MFDLLENCSVNVSAHGGVSGRKRPARGPVATLPRE